MSTENKHTEWILETIDHLRRRKARPDLQRICHVVRRNFGLLATETEAKLEKLVDSEIVIKVDYKGSTSYRNAAKWRKSMLGCAVQNSRKVSMKVIEAILSIRKTITKDIQPKTLENGPTDDDEANSKETESAEVSIVGTTKGASFKEIIGWLQKYYDGYKQMKSPMTVVLKREIDAGRIRKVEEDGSFVLTDAQKGLIKKDTINIIDFPKRMDQSNSVAYINGKNNNAYNMHKTGMVKLGIHGHQPARRGRPPKYRPPLTSMPDLTSDTPKPPKLKRSASTASGGESGSSPPSKVLKKEECHNSNVCDVCHLTSNSQGKGHPEILLHCSDCAVKAHPSCLKYNPVLASRARKGPWQCTDCKTCCVCHDSGQPNQMLFCDGCDKGYHMTCHQPNVSKKPSGLWECYECRLENSTLQRSEFFAMHDQRDSEARDSTPPTPAESPVPSSSHNCHTYPDASDWSVSDVVEFFTSAGFSKEAEIFKDQEIDGIAVLLLRRSDVLKGLDLKLGPALKINRLVEGLQTAKQQMT